MIMTVTCDMCGASIHPYADTARFLDSDHEETCAALKGATAIRAATPKDDDR